MKYKVTLADGNKLTVLAFKQGTKAEARRRVKNFYPDANIKSVTKK